MSTLHNKRVLITAGPTVEAIDPVRFISNHSSGKMGYSLAKNLINEGAVVTLISGPTHLQKPEGVNLIAVNSAHEMYEAVLMHLNSSDIIILAAAVADYTPVSPTKEKIKKQEDVLTLELKKTVDIAYEVGKLKKDNQLTVGFALETNNVLENAKQKLDKKNFDFIVLNSLSNTHTPFDSDENKITIIEDNNIIDFELKSKELIASDIIAHIKTRINA